MVCLIDLDYRPFSSAGDVMGMRPRADPNYSWIPTFAHVLYQSMQDMGVNYAAVFSFVPWLEQHIDFEDVQSSDLLLPINPWYSNPG